MQISPGAPRPPRGFDLSRVDTPLEAMLMPGADLWAGLVVGTMPGRVLVESGDQRLTYENVVDSHGLTVKGHINGQPFQLNTAPADHMGTAYRGETSGGVVDTVLRGGGSGFGFDGKVGDVELSEMLALDQSGSPDRLAYLHGTFQGAELEARARRGPDHTVLVEGTLGQDLVRESIRLGPHGEWILHGQVGDQRFREILQPR